MDKIHGIFIFISVNLQSTEISVVRKYMNIPKGTNPGLNPTGW